MTGDKKARLLRAFASPWFLWAALATGLAARVVWVVAAGDVQRFWDADSYIKIADSVLAGNGFRWGDPASSSIVQLVGRPPLYPLLVAATRFDLFGREFLAIYLVQALLSVATIALFAAGARRLLGGAAAGATALLVALDPFLIFNVATVLTETLFTFFLGLFFFAFAKVVAPDGMSGSKQRSTGGSASLTPAPLPKGEGTRKANSQAEGEGTHRATSQAARSPKEETAKGASGTHSTFDALMMGVAAGGSFLTRPSLLWLVALFALFVLIWARPRWKALVSTVAMLAVAFAIVLPWGVRNHRVTGHRIFTTLGVGASLYDGLGPQADGSSNMDFMRDPALARMGEYERDRYLSDKALEAAAASPGRAARLAAVKVARFWSPVPNNALFCSLPYVAASLLYVVPIYVLALLALVRRAVSRRVLMILLAAPLYFTLVHSVFVSSARYRTPVMPFVAMLGAAWLAGRAPAASGSAKADAAKPGSPANPDETPEDAVAKRFGGRKRRHPTLPFRIFMGILIFFVVCGLAGYFYYDRWLANPDNVRALAASKIGLLFPGKKIALGSAKFTLFGGLDLYQVAVSEKETGVGIARLDKVHIDFDLSKLSRLSLMPRNVRADGLFLDLVRMPDGKWNLPIPTSSEAAHGKPPLALPFTLSLGSAFVSIDDRYSGYSASCTVDSINAMTGDSSVSNWSMSAGLGSALLGKWRVSARGDADAHLLDAQFAVTDIDLGQGLENRLPPAARSVYRKFNPAGLADVKGKVSYSPEAGWDFDVSSLLKGCQVTYYRFPLTVKDLNGAIDLDRKGFRFANLRGETSPGTVAISGSGGLGADAPLSIITLSQGLVVDERLLSAIPESAQRAIRKFHPSGRIDATARFEREAGPGKHVEVAVDAMLDGLSAKYDVFPVAVDKVRGRMGFAGGDVYVDNLVASRGDSELIISGKITDTLHSPVVDMRIAVKGMELDEELRNALPRKAAAVWQSLGLGGRADIAANIARPANGPTDVAFTADLAGTALNYEKVPYALSDGAGRVVYREGVFSLSEVSFRHGPGGVKVSGTANMESGEMNLAFEAADLPLDGELYKAVPDAVRKYFDRLGISGFADAEVAVTRSADSKLSFGGVTARLKNGQLLEPTVPIGVGDASAEVAYSNGTLAVRNLDGSIFPDNVSLLFPALRLASAALPASRGSVDCDIDMGKAGDWSVDFDTRKVVVGDGFLATLPESARRMLAERDVQGLADIGGGLDYTEVEDGPQIAYDLNISSSDSRMTLGKPVDDVAGDIDISGDWSGEPTSFRATGALAGLTFAGRKMGETQFVLDKTSGEARIERFTTKALGGTLSGQGRVAFSDSKGYAFVVNMKDVSLSDLLVKAFGYTKRNLTGNVNGRLRMLSQGPNPRDFIGSAEATVTNGTLWEVPFILAVMNVMNLKLPERTQFEEAHIRCNIAGNRILVDELSMSSDPATILGKGVIGLDGTMDLTFYSRPGRIPVVSELWGEVGKQIVRARVTGTFANPRVTLIASGPVGKFLDWLGKRFRK